MLEWPVVALDDFVRAPAAPYPDMLDMAALKATLAAASYCIVEGVLMLDVLERMHIRPTVHVYVRRWTDGNRLEAPDYWELSPDEVIAQEEGICALIGAGPDEAVLGRELAYYHRQFRPFDVADIVFENFPG